MYWKLPIGADLSKTSYRAMHVTDSFWYIERNEGFVGEDWVQLTDEEIREIAPEFFEEQQYDDTASKLNRIEKMVETNYADAKQEGSDALLAELLERGVL